MHLFESSLKPRWTIKSKTSEVSQKQAFNGYSINMKAPMIALLSILKTTNR